MKFCNYNENFFKAGLLMLDEDEEDFPEEIDLKSLGIDYQFDREYEE